jgi:cytochrome c oxidase accessory protein FixG
MSLPPQSPTLESVSTINKDGSRRFVHAASVKGRFTTARWIVFSFLIAVYVLLPWIPVNGYPAVLLDSQHRQFHFFGLTFVTQDLWLGFFLVSGIAFSLFYVSALFGRVWCGWGCPQTVFLEVARKIERWVEGDSFARVRLGRQPWTGTKTIKRVTKHLLYVLFAGILAHVFLSYFVSLTRLYRMMTSAPVENWGSFFLVAGMTAALWFNFHWFREQFCIVLCPYGRLQSALIDKHSIVIGYDEKRGEPRGRKGTVGSGDCVNCLRCVAVFPTGIDIRQGVQIECIGCSACIDACDTVMTKIGQPRGLIRYDSGEGLTGRKTKWIRPRIILYTALMLIGAIAMSIGLTTLKPATVSLLRIQGAPYFIDGGQVRNQFFLRVLNKRNHAESYRVELVGAPPSLRTTGLDEPLQVAALGEEMRPVVMTIPRADFHEDPTFKVCILDSTGAAVAERRVTFLGPFTP